jgi:hypothetical protein
MNSYNQTLFIVGDGQSQSSFDLLGIKYEFGDFEPQQHVLVKDYCHSLVNDKHVELDRASGGA